MKKIFPLFVAIIILVLAVCSFHIIPTGYTGVKTSFGQRRKMLRGSLKGMFPKGCELLQDPFFALRPEQLSVADFVRLTNMVAEANQK